MVIVPGSVGVIVDEVSVIVPEQALAPSKLSKAADDSVTFVVPLIIFGESVTDPPAGTPIVSGFKSHSEAGCVLVLPVITSKVAEYGAKLILGVHALEPDAVMVPGAVDAVV